MTVESRVAASQRLINQKGAGTSFASAWNLNRTMPTSNENSGTGAHLSEALLSFARHRHVEPGRIARLIRDSELFREICADYEECCSRLLNLAQKAVTAGTLVRDYEEMREQLERDLLHCLKDLANRRTNGRQAGQVTTE